jgi:predicted transcriptional regulator
MTRTELLGVRVSPSIKDELLRLAKVEDRSLASMVERALAEWLERRAVRDAKRVGQRS